MGRAAKIVFMGTPAFAVPSLKALIGAGHNVQAAVTMPDRPKGRGLTVERSPVKEAALSHNIEVLEPLKMKDPAFLARLRELSPDFIAVVAYGKILPQEVLGLPAKGCVNVHASLLPKYRGAAPINWAIVNNEKTTGVTTMLMDRGMDTGPVFLREAAPICEDDTAEDLSIRLSESGARLLVKTIDLIIEDKIAPVPQDNEGASYAPILKKEDGLIDWSKGAREVRSLVRGLYPWPGAYTFWKDKGLKIYSGRALEESASVVPGTVVDITKEGIKVACGRNVFEILELKPEGKKKMKAGEFISGYRLTKGERFGG